MRKFQAHFEVLHRLHLNPWACASLANHSASSLPPWFPSPFVSVDLLCSGVTLNDHSHCSEVPRLLIPHPHLDWPEAGSAALWEEVQ